LESGRNFTSELLPMTKFMLGADCSAIFLGKSCTMVRVVFFCIALNLDSLVSIKVEDGTYWAATVLLVELSGVWGRKTGASRPIRLL